jgi:hypothetical protein
MKLFRFEATYIDDRGKFTQTEVIAQDESEADDRLWDEDYYYGGGANLNECGEVYEDSDDYKEYVREN